MLERVLAEQMDKILVCFVAVPITLEAGALASSSFSGAKVKSTACKAAMLEMRTAVHTARLRAPC